jgi:thiamine-phosphate pyrophosphorylase
VLRYAITDRTQYPGDEPARHVALIDQAAQLAARSLDYLQLREKDLPAAALADLAREILAILKNSTTKLLINSRADIALATRAHGVHLTSAPGALTPAQVRALYARASLPTPIVSLSCHTLEEVARAAQSPEEARPNLILFGPVFEKVVPAPPISAHTTTQIPNSAPQQNKSTQTLPGSGLELLAAACRAATPIPVLALGGITEQNTPTALSTGAAGIAAIRLFLTGQLGM